MTTGIDMATGLPIRHCLYCKEATTDINDEPCRTCMHTEPTGRARPLFIPKDRQETLEPEKIIVMSLPEQQSLF